MRESESDRSLAFERHDVFSHDGCSLLPLPAIGPVGEMTPPSNASARVNLQWSSSYTHSSTQPSVKPTTSICGCEPLGCGVRVRVGI